MASRTGPPSAYHAGSKVARGGDEARVTHDCGSILDSIAKCEPWSLISPEACARSAALAKSPESDPRTHGIVTGPG